MRYRNLLFALVSSVMMLAILNTAEAQRDTVRPHNNTIMNAYTYTPELYQRGSSMAGIKMYPNPAHSVATIYINSIKEIDNGEVAIFNTNGTLVYKNTLQPGNNDVNLGGFSNGMYIVKVFTKDRFVYTKKLMVSKF